MSKRIIFISVVCLSMTVLTVQTLSRTRSSNRKVKPPDSERLRNMTDAERKKEIEKRREQRKLEREQRRKESKKKLDEIRERQKERKESWEKAKEEAGGFIYEKYALRATKEQWKLIRAKLEKLQDLREQANSMVGVSLTSLSGSGTRTRDSRNRSVPTWKWKIRRKDNVPAELTEAQKIAKELIALVERKNTTPEAFGRKMAALRKARSKEAELERQLSEAQQELREVLTTRQEAALVLKGWL